MGQYSSSVTRKPAFDVSGTNRVAQPHKMARGFKFWIYKVEGKRKTKALISYAVTVQLICAVFANAKGWFSYDTAYLKEIF